MSLKFIPISGTTGVAQNLYLYEYKDEMIIVDCGVGFPESDMLGVDLIIPDFSYIRDNAKKLKAILISHGHEDHLGALPFLLKDVQAPIYATKLVAGFIEEKLDDHRIKFSDLRVFDPEKDVLTIGSFRVTPFRISHSVPDSVGFCIDTPEGKMFHVPDYKFDWTPVDHRPFDVAKAAGLASGGVLALASDSVGATTPGYTESELFIEKKIEEIARNSKRQIFFTTISSNISRMQQALNVAQKLGRKVVFIGRSIDRKAEIAKRLGYLYYPDNLVVNPKQASRLPEKEIMYIISGSYGQPGSALYRAALGEHDYVFIEEGDLVIFSSDPAPPGSKANVDFVVDKLIEMNVEVHYYDMQEDLHVSGHGSQKDIEMLFALIKPKYYIPIGGTVRHMRAYQDLADKMGAIRENVFKLMPGDVLEFEANSAEIVDQIPVKDVLVDGLGIGDVGNVVLRDRQILSKDGIAIVMLQIDKNAGKLIETPEIISRGFVFGAKNQQMLTEAGRALEKYLNKGSRVDAHSARTKAVDYLEKYFHKATGRRPMLLPLIIEV